MSLTMRSFFNDFQALLSAKREAGLGEMKVFLESFELAQRESRFRAPVDFNVFSLLLVETDEVRHSAVLAWLLDARSGHGQGTLFLNALASLCALDIPPQAFDKYRVRTELAGIESIVDIAVYRRGSFLIFLENKVLAAEGPGQLQREFRDMRRLGSVLGVPRERQFAVFLSPAGRKPVSGDPASWHAISYGRLALCFEELLSQIGTEKVALLLRDWIRTVRTFEGAYDRAV